MAEPAKIIDTLPDQVKSTVEDAIEPTLAERVEAARLRSADLATSATKSARDFVHDHPVATIAGGIAIGALVAGAFARSLPAKTESAAKKAGADVDVISERLSHLASIGADLALAYVARAATASKEGASKLDDHVSKLSEEAGKSGAELSRKAAGIADLVINSLRDAGETALSRLNKAKP